MRCWTRLLVVGALGLSLASACGGGGGGGGSFLIITEGDYDLTVTTATPICQGFDLDESWTAGLRDLTATRAELKLYVPEAGACPAVTIRLEGTWISDTRIDVDDVVDLQLCQLNDAYELRFFSIRNALIDVMADRSEFTLTGDFEGNVGTRVCFGIITMSGVDT